MNDMILETANLTKTYKNVTALNDFSITLEKNKIYGLLGRNGAGKTTLLNLLTSRIFAHSGDINIFGENAVESEAALSKICYMPEKNMFIPKMKVKEIIATSSEFYENFDMNYADKLCDKFKLSKGKKYHELSRGYESILRIVIGLASHSPITIFDEPVLGLDAAVRDMFYKELLEDFIEHPRTIIISTHLIEESANIFSDIIIIKDGKLISLTSTEELRESMFYCSGREDIIDRVLSDMNVIHTEMVGSVKVCVVHQKLEASELKRLQDENLDVSPIPIQKLFIYFTDNDKEATHE